LFLTFKYYAFIFCSN